MPRRKIATSDSDDDLFFAFVLPNPVIGKKSECAPLLAAWESQGVRIRYGRGAALLRDLGYRINSGPETPELGGRWADHIAHICACITKFRKAGSAGESEFLSSAEREVAEALYNWDFDRGGGIVPADQPLPEGVMRGRPVHAKRRPGPLPPGRGATLPPLEDYEMKMVRALLRVAPWMRRSGARGRPRLYNWRLEGPSVHSAIAGGLISSRGQLLSFYRRFCLNYRAYRYASKSQREAKAAALRGEITGIIGTPDQPGLDPADAAERRRWIKAALSPDLRSYKWLFCQILAYRVRRDIAEIGNFAEVAPETIKSRLIEHLRTWRKVRRIAPRHAFPGRPY